MNKFERACKIWIDKEAKPDEYGEFYTEFEYNGGECELLITADSNYAAYVNGRLCASMQYADYPYDKIHDEIDISQFLCRGVNRLAVVVWYYGTSETQVYYKGEASLCFEVRENGKIAAFSSEKTLSRQSRAYLSHSCKQITSQLGFSYHYDASAEDGWLFGELDGFSQSRVIEREVKTRKRPVKRLDTSKFTEAKPIMTLDKGVLYDLGVNTVGLLEIETEACEKNDITVAYGEHIADGEVRRLISSRDFSVSLTVGEGKTAYTNPFRRLAARYLQVEASSAVKIKRIGLRETLYPLTSRPRPKLDSEESAIYDICERTLRLCMHEHYEDCPWREQALYAMDSRNQMLCGYYAFGEYEFPRACIQLMAADSREDGLLSICYPTSRDLVIPSFSLHFFTLCAEYLRYSGDMELIKSIYPKLTSIINVFLEKGAVDGRVISPFLGDSYWNFYEWSAGLSGGKAFADVPDLILNCLLSIALKNMAYLSSEIGVQNSYAQISDKLNSAIRAEFFDVERGLFRDRNTSVSYSVLGNSLALLSGAALEVDGGEIAQRLISDSSLTPISLSMRCFLNDALLKVDAEKYAPIILSDIKKIYLPMVQAGIGTVWETEKGDSDFGNAGSLCHGWSALPIYYYHILS